MDYQQLAGQMAAKYGIPPDLFMRQINQESRWNPKAVSPAGAQGLGQIMPGTQDYLGITDPFDPVQSLDGAARYLKEQYDKFGDWKLALAAYNAGPGAVQKYGGVPPYRETRNYVDIITGNRSSAAQPPAATQQATQEDTGKEAQRRKRFASLLSNPSDTSVRDAYASAGALDIPAPVALAYLGNRLSPQQRDDLESDFERGLVRLPESVLNMLAKKRRARGRE